MSLPVVVVAAPTVYPEPEISRDAVSHWMAKRLLGSRDMRTRVTEACELSEAGWQMLLDLFVAKQLGHRVSVTDLALAAQVPKSTGLRIAAQLVENGLAIREADPNDGRRQWMRIAESTQAKLDDYLVDAARLFSTPLKGTEIRIFMGEVVRTNPVPIQGSEY